MRELAKLSEIKLDDTILYRIHITTGFSISKKTKQYRGGSNIIEDGRSSDEYELVFRMYDIKYRILWNLTLQI